MNHRPSSIGFAVIARLLCPLFGLAALAPSGKAAEFFSDLKFEVRSVPGQNGQPDSHTSSLSWNNPGRNSYYVQVSTDMEHWTTIHHGWAASDDVTILPVLTTTPDLLPPPPKPTRTVSLRPSTAGWHAAWIDLLDGSPVPVVQPLATPPDPRCPLLFTAETPTHRLIFTCIPPPDDTPLPPPIWTDIPPLTSLHPTLQATCAAIVSALSQPPPTDDTGSPLLLPASDPNAGRHFNRVEYRLDSDFDGLPDSEELGLPDASGNPSSFPFRTDPFDPDTDRDGFSDLIEKMEGTSPLDATSQPPPLPEPVLEVRYRSGEFHWFDDSDGHHPYEEGHGVFSTHRFPEPSNTDIYHDVHYATFPDGPDTLLEALTQQEPFEPRKTLLPAQLAIVYPVGGDALARFDLDSSGLGPLGAPWAGEWDIHRLQDARLWLKTSPPSTQPITRTLHFLTTGRYNQIAGLDQTGEPMPPTIVSHTFTIPPQTPTDQAAGAYSEPLDLHAVIPFNDSMQDGLEHTTVTRLLPVEVKSMDRYLAGSLPQSTIDALGGDSKFGLVFRNTASGEEYRFNKISEAHVYDNPLMSSPDAEDKFLSNSEISAWANGPNSSTKELTQEVVFYRQDGSLHFRGLFDEAGQIEIGLLKDGTEVGKITHTLTPDPDIGHLLETVDGILAGTWDDPGGIILAAMQQGVSGDELEALRNAANQAAAASFGDQSDAGGFTGFLRRNLTIKVNIPAWQACKDKFVNGVRKAGEATARAIKVVAFTGKGFAEGAWMGVKDDATSLVELGKMIVNPAETAKTFYEGFKVLIDLDMEGWKNVGKTLVKSFLEKGDEGAGEWAEPNNLDVAAYLVGFTAGFITEQIVVTYVTAGIVKAGNIGAKIGQFLRRAASGLATALEGAAQAVRTLMMKSKNSLFRRFSQDVLSAEDVKTLKRVLQELELACPL